MNWRESARKHIREAIEEGRRMGLEGSALKKHANAAYPFGERAMHPYKIWLGEMARHFPKPKPKPDRAEPLFDSHPFLAMPKGDE